MRARLVLIAGLAVLGLAACGKKDNEPVLVEAPAPVALPRPIVKIADLKELPTPLPLPYNEAATDAEVDQALDAAFERAKASGKRVVVDLGGNWCSWCRNLSGVMALPEVKPFLDQNFEIVHVAIGAKTGQMDQRPNVRERFGIAKVDGTPWLVVAEADGKVLASSYEVTDKQHETPQAMVNWLAQFAKGGARA